MFTSAILPPYPRRTRGVEELIPWLYLDGISTGDMSEALSALLGPQAAGLSAATVTRLKVVWESDFRQWSGRSLAGKRYVYVWVDGIYFNIRLEDPGNARQCILVMIGATPEGHKEILAISDGYRESYQSWRELMPDLKRRGLTDPPRLAIGTVRLRTDKTRGCGSRTACLTMVFKLALVAQQSWRALHGHALIPDVIAGVKFADGVKHRPPDQQVIHEI